MSAAGGWGLSAAAPAAVEQTKAAVVMPKDKIVLYQVRWRRGPDVSLVQLTPPVLQYNVCPFCCKVKAFLDFHKVRRNP
jgi:hypothetical protein